MQFLDIVRGVAVLGVLAFHGVATTHHGTHRPAVLLWPLAAGKLGVDVFFVISGFVIARSYASKARDAAGSRAFLGRRIQRLFPAYWASLVVFVLIKGRHLFHSFEGVGIFLLHVVGQQFMVPNASWQINSVYWTLTPTIHFYLLFPLLMYAVHRFRTLAPLFVAIAGSIAFRVAIHSASQWPADTILGRLDQFAVGMVVALVATRSNRILDALRKPVAGKIAMGGLAALVFFYGSSWVGAPHLQRVVAETVVHPLFAILLGIRLLRLPQGGELSLPARGLAALGVISYSVYLWHLPIVDWLGDAGFPGVLAAIFASIVVGTISYHALERPTFRLRRKDSTRSDVPMGRERDDAHRLAGVR